MRKIYFIEMNVEKNVIIDCFVVILFKISWLFIIYY